MDKAAREIVRREKAKVAARNGMRRIRAIEKNKRAEKDARLKLLSQLRKAKQRPKSKVPCSTTAHPIPSPPSPSSIATSAEFESDWQHRSQQRHERLISLRNKGGRGNIGNGGRQQRLLMLRRAYRMDLGDGQEGFYSEAELEAIYGDQVDEELLLIRREIGIGSQRDYMSTFPFVYSLAAPSSPPACTTVRAVEDSDSLPPSDLSSEED